MELQSYRHYNDPISDTLANLQQLAEIQPACDSRYRNIIDQLDDMIELHHQQPGRNLATELNHLLDAMMVHIRSEDSVMGLVGFPLIVKHRLHHQFICTNTAELLHRFSKGQDVPSDELTSIRLLWMEHIRVHDRAFEEYLAS